MDFQYYDTLEDKSDEAILGFVKRIIPTFTKGELRLFIGDLANLKPRSNPKSQITTDYFEIGEDYDTTGDLSKLTSNQLKLFYQIFISRELCHKKAIKWRFYQNLKYIRDFAFESIHINRTDKEDEQIDFIIELGDGKRVFVNCFEVLDLDSYIEATNYVIEFSKKRKIIPVNLLFVANKSYRDLPISEDFAIGKNIVSPKLWLEWVDISKPFNGEDLIVITTKKQENFELAGFNFTNLQDLLDYVYEFGNGGQISVFKYSSYFAEVAKEELQTELIWKGIMIKTNIY